MAKGHDFEQYFVDEGPAGLDEYFVENEVAPQSIQNVPQTLEESMQYLANQNQQPGYFERILTPKKGNNAQAFKDIREYFTGGAAKQRAADERQQRLADALASQQFALGAAQGIADLPPNIISSLPGVSMPRSTGFSQFSPEGEGKELFETMGSVAGQLPLGGAAFRGVTTPKLTNPLARYLGNAVAGGGISYAFAPEELKNEAALVGAALPLATGAVKGAINLPKVTNRAVGNEIVNDFKRIKAGFKKEYNDFFNEAERAGVDRVVTKVPRKDLKTLVKSMSPKQEEILRKYLTNPSVRNAHDLQRVSGQLARRLEKKANIGSLEGNESDVLRAALKVQENVRTGMAKALMDKGGFDLPFKYMDITKRYGTDLGPYLDNKAIRKAALNPKKEGAINPSRLPAKLAHERSDPFHENFPGRYPNYEMNRFLASPLAKGILGGTVLGGSALKAYDLLKL